MKITKITFLFLITSSLVISSCKKDGCTDPTADNYNSSANNDDGSCIYNNSGNLTTVTSDITAPTTWSGTVNVCGSIDVEAALTINEGTVINMCASSRIYVQSSGSMYAIGSTSNPIIFKGEVNSPGYWKGIKIMSNDPQNVLNYVTIQDAGGNFELDDAGLNIHSSSQISLSNCTLSNNSHNGIYVEETAIITSFSDNTLSNNGQAGLNIKANHLASIDVQSNYNNNNGQPYIVVRGGNVTTNSTWLATTTPYLFTGNVGIKAGLTIEEGAHLKFGQEKAIDIEASGYISAIGTTTEPIVMEGEFSSPGYWMGVTILSNNPLNDFEYVTVKDGGQNWSDDYSSIILKSGGRLELDNCTVNNSNSWGIYVRNSCAIVTNGAPQTTVGGVTANNDLSGNGVGPDAACSGGGCTIQFE